MGLGRCMQGCESRRQKNSTCSRPKYREIRKVSSLSRSLPLSGKKVSPRPSPRSGFPRPPHAENEPSIAVRGSRPPPPRSVFSALIYRPSFRENKPNTLVFSNRKRANWACFAKTRSLNLDTGQCFLFILHFKISRKLGL